ncbi:MAG: LLM class flavin-dependent oxidoreductase [Rhodospirillaceae bacterium]|nr:LLM class flavin-dependent oxidoreductase [Rhodospirillaceae bacterium]|tara:strand:- start:654 stop:1757 length:1104 start_codon:yes stop_codon:yes gene_type:complete
MARPSTRMENTNRFKLGLFCTNGSGGLAMTKVPERWDASWDNNVTATQMGEAAGLEFTLPIARWHGYRGETNTQGEALETLTWATGMLSCTEEITVFGTVHVPLVNPVFAAKQMISADHAGCGRFGLNLVSGWNAGEFDMFGVKLREHDERYDYSAEWVEIVRRIWAEEKAFDYQGKFFDLKGVLLNPKPYGGGRPLLMSAGSSPAGRTFAANNVDCLFMAIPGLDGLADEISGVKKALGRRDMGIYASGHIVCRPTQKEAEEYYHYYVHEMGDWDAVEHIISIRQQSQSIPPDALSKMKERLISGVGTFPVVGSPDSIAEMYERMADAGLNGMAIGMVNYIDEIPFVEAELLPRMQRLGLRDPATP